jgi:predicted CopG family antitoxin
MLDHDDLFSNLVKKKESPEKFKDYIISLTNFCQKNNIILLRTIGVVFSDEETRDIQYIK